MARFGNKATFKEGEENPKRRAAKKARGFGLGKIGSVDKATLDAWCQKRDPLFKVKGKERTLKNKQFK